MRLRLLLCQITLSFPLLSALPRNEQDAGTLHLEKEIPLPGVEGRIDHFSEDIRGQRLFIAALENGSVEIIDTHKGERTAEIKQLQEPQGVYYDSKTGGLYVATGGDGRLRVYDGKSLIVRQTLELGHDADNVRYDQEVGDIWVGYGNGGIGIVDSTGKKVGLVELGTHPESFQIEHSGGRAYVNLPGQFGVAVVDRKKRAVVAKWGLDGSFANYPMALDPTNKRLFVGCRLPARLVVLDIDSGRVVAALPTVADSDDLYYDAKRRLIYVIGGEGAVDVLRQRDPNNYERVERTATASGARTGLFAPEFDRLFVAVPHRGSQAAKILVYQITQSAR